MHKRGQRRSWGMPWRRYLGDRIDVGIYMLAANVDPGYQSPIGAAVAQSLVLSTSLS